MPHLYLQKTNQNIKKLINVGTNTIDSPAFSNYHKNKKQTKTQKKLFATREFLNLLLPAPAFSNYHKIIIILNTNPRAHRYILTTKATYLDEMVSGLALGPFPSPFTNHVFGVAGANKTCILQAAISPLLVRI